MSEETGRHFLKSASLRLTLTYLGIIMLMSIGFSIVFYRTSFSQLGRQLPPRSLYVSDVSGFDPGRFRPDIDQFLRDRIDEGRHELLTRLIALNIMALGLGGALSYYLARRTLEPIEEVMASQSQFVSDASHELKTPLTAIQASNEVALRKPKLSLAEAKQVIRQNTEDIVKLRELSEALLTLAKDGSKSLPIAPVPLQEAVSEALNKVVKVAQAKNITVEDKTPNIRVMADKQSLIQVLTILLDNAVKYGSDGTTVTLNADSRAKQVRVHVIDQGPGISSRDVPHIFKRFYQAERSRSKGENEGYGLGLSIAKQLMDQLGGEITVVSKLEKGSTFTISLPAAP